MFMEAISAQCLLGACASGANDNAWREFMRRYRKGLESGIRRGMRRVDYFAAQDEVEDVMQEVYCRLLEAGGRRLRSTRGTTDGEIGSYLRRLAANVVLDRIRAARAAKRQGAVVGALSGGDDGLQDPRPSIEDALLFRERAAGALRACRGRRHGSDRTVWIARKALVEGWSSVEISRALAGALSSGAVDALLSRVYRRLRVAGLRLPARAGAGRRRGERRARSRAATAGEGALG